MAARARKLSLSAFSMNVLLCCNVLLMTVSLPDFPPLVMTDMSGVLPEAVNSLTFLGNAVITLELDEEIDSRDHMSVS